MKRAATLLAVLGALAVGCATYDVAYDFDPQADFRRLGTYGWFPGPQPDTGDPRLDNTIVDSRIRAAVDTHLATKGYKKDFADKADFLVAYHAAINHKLDIATVDRYYGPGPRWAGMVVTDTTVREWDQGTLILDVVDRRSRKLLWRGSVQAQVTNRASPAERTERVRAAVAQMLEKFPPPEAR